VQPWLSLTSQMSFLLSALQVLLLGSLLGIPLQWGVHAMLDPKQMAQHLEAGKPLLGM